MNIFWTKKKKIKNEEQLQSKCIHKYFQNVSSYNNVQPFVTMAKGLTKKKNINKKTEWKFFINLQLEYLIKASSIYLQIEVSM